MKEKKSLQKLVVSYSSFTAIVIAFAVWPLPGFENSPTGFHLLHNHAEKWIVELRYSVDNNTKLISNLDERHEFQSQLDKLEALYRWHEMQLEYLVNEDDNFKSEAKRKRWERRDDEIRQDIDRLENLIEKNKHAYADRIMLAHKGS